MQIITMTTVGYGDLFPISYPSKFVGIICAFYGVYVVTLFVITIERMLETNEGEERAYILVMALM